MRRLWLPLALVVASLAIAGTRPVGADYGNLDCQLRLPYCDDAKPVLDAIAGGKLHAFWDQQTLLGPASIVVRAPFVAIAEAAGASVRTEYRVGVLACLLALAAAAWLLADELRRRGRPGWLQWLLALGLVVNPLTFRVANFGHPEEALGAAAVLAAGVLAVRAAATGAAPTGAPRGGAAATGAAPVGASARAAGAGALAGVAVATKLWGILAVAPLVAAVPRALWRRAAIAAAGTAALLYALPAVGAPSRFRDAVASGNDLGTIPGTAQASNIWWFFMDKVPYERAVAVVDGKIVLAQQVGFVLGPPLGSIVHPLVVALALVVALLWAVRRRPGADPADVLLVLAAIFLMRCVLDPNNFSYYHLPFLACLMGWEGLARGGLPLLSAWATAGLAAIISLSPHIHSDAGFVWLYLGWVLTVGLGAIARYRFGAGPAGTPSTTITSSVGPLGTRLYGD